jgi:transcriptional regulator with XRE-family HTH domain
MSKEKRDWSDVIRKAMLESGLSLNQLGKASAIDGGQLSRFMRGKRDLTLASAAKLCEALGLRLAQREEGGVTVAPASAATPKRPTRKRK